MDIRLAENIRRNRKDRKMTQEQLAEVLGVTAGAVYKWESGLSVPELDMLMSMADLFDCSVDALLGYRIKDSRLDALKERMQEYVRTRDRRALEEAENAIIRYPNDFEAVKNAAMAYFVFGAASHDETELRRALQLYEQMLALLPQNSDPRINEQTVYGEMADIVILLGDMEKGVEMLKQHNGGAQYSESVGLFLATELGRYEEAEPYLSQGFIKGMSALLNSVTGYAAVLLKRGDSGEAEGLVRWMIALLEGVRKEGRPDFLDKVQAELLALLAYSEKIGGNTEKARMTLKEAAEAAERFDSDPDYGIQNLRFIRVDEAFALDMLGDTAHDALGNMIGIYADSEFYGMWEEISNV